MRCHHYITTQRNISPGPGSHAIDGADNRFLQIRDAGNNRIVMLRQDFVKPGCIVADSLTEILSGTESPCRFPLDKLLLYFYCCAIV